MSAVAGLNTASYLLSMLQLAMQLNEHNYNDKLMTRYLKSNWEVANCKKF